MATTFPGTIPSISTLNIHRVSFALENPGQASSSGCSLSGHYEDATALAVHRTSPKAPGHERKTAGSVTSHVAVLGIVSPPSGHYSQPQSTTGATRTYARTRMISSYTINDLSTALAKFQNDERVSRALGKAIWLILGRARSRYIVKSQGRSSAWVRDVQNEVGGIGKAIDGIEKRLDGIARSFVGTEAQATGWEGERGHRRPQRVLNVNRR
ncbi:hypothetical protein DL96DRAFT_1560436 [Flagelloscypha sp. PMI_526]|nr:hypothetical protein DL96DRAFT_1560436 [Flagelloscypha sp. PMI_526]